MELHWWKCAYRRHFFKTFICFALAFWTYSIINNMQYKTVGQNYTCLSALKSTWASIPITPMESAPFKRLWTVWNLVLPVFVDHVIANLTALEVSMWFSTSTLLCKVWEASSWTIFRWKFVCCKLRKEIMFSSFGALLSKIYDCFSAIITIP